MEIHHKLIMFNKKQTQCYNTARNYVKNKENLKEVYLTTAVNDVMAKSKRDNREFMEKLSNCSPTPSLNPRNHSRAHNISQSVRDSSKKVR
jgi:hypothetical protein